MAKDNRWRARVGRTMTWGFALACSLGPLSACYRVASFNPEEVLEIKQRSPESVEVTYWSGEVVSILHYDEIAIQEKDNQRGIRWALRRAEFESPAELTLDSQMVRVQKSGKMRVLARGSVEEIAFVEHAPERGAMILGVTAGAFTLCSLGILASGVHVITHSSSDCPAGRCGEQSTGDGAAALVGGLLCAGAGLLISASASGNLHVHKRASAPASHLQYRGLAVE